MKEVKLVNKKKPLLSPFAIVVILAAIVLAAFAGWGSMRQSQEAKIPAENIAPTFTPEITKTDDEWKALLTSQQYYVLRQKGTDAPFSEDVLLHEKRKGTYVTADCGEPVFRSEQKYDSGTGWPSFWAPIEGSVVELPDEGYGLERTEIVGKKCGGHLGHVFKDGPEPTGLRYCINPSALKFIPDP